jgi:probable rRNA maturation factor
MEPDSRKTFFDIDVLADDDRWPAAFGSSFNEQDLFERLASKTFELLKWHRLCTISVLLTNDAHIQRLNYEYRGKDKPTNVLSFEGYDDATLNLLPPSEPILLGDIVFSFDTVQREAVVQNKTFVDHVSHLFVHGLLHLMGYDHEEDEMAEVMEALEVRILHFFSINNPYND